MVNLTNLMLGWKERPLNGGYHVMLLRLHTLQKDKADELLEFCRDFRIDHPLVPTIEQEWSQGVSDATKCVMLFNDINKF